MTEFASFAETDKAWTYHTWYDLAVRSKILAEHGADSQRFQDIENYIDYINNDMPDNYRVSTQVTEPRAYPAYASAVSRGIYSAYLLRPDESGRFVPYRTVSRIVKFLGDKVTVQDDNVYIVNTKYNLAVQPLEGMSVELINIAHEYGSKNGNSEYQKFEFRAREITENRPIGAYAVHQHYQI